MAELTITTIAERPDLADRLHEVRNTWPAFLNKDRLANAFFQQVAWTFPEYCVVATVEDGTLIARGSSIPFSADLPERELYPDGGWDSVVLWGLTDHSQAISPTAASALDIVVDEDHLGKGLSFEMLTALRRAVRKLGHDSLVAPVRPTEKRHQPHLPTAEYITHTRDDGLPVDSWLRVHVRAGGTIVKVAPASAVSAGSLAQWRGWTGLPFDSNGDVEVPEALVPVHCDLAHGYAVYVEPNVWVHHNLRTVDPDG